MRSFEKLKKDLLESVTIMRYPIAICVLCAVCIFMCGWVQDFESIYSFAYGLLAVVGVILFGFISSVLVIAIIIVLFLRYLFRQNFYDCSFIYPGGAH